MSLYNEETKKVGDIDIPDDVIAAAQKVAQWLSENQAIELYGLRFADLMPRPVE